MSSVANLPQFPPEILENIIHYYLILARQTPQTYPGSALRVSSVSSSFILIVSRFNKNQLETTQSEREKVHEEIVQWHCAKGMSKRMYRSCAHWDPWRKLAKEVLLFQSVKNALGRIKDVQGDPKWLVDSKK